MTRRDALRALRMIWRRFFRHHRGMIRPNMGMGFEDSVEIMRRKSADMVFYLRARRTIIEYAEPSHIRRNALKQKRMARQEHLRALIAQEGGE